MLDKKVYREAIEAVSAVVLIVSLLVGMGVPHQVSADSEVLFTNVTTTLTTTDNGIDVFGTDVTPKAVFPDISDRAPKRVVWAVATSYSSDVGQTDATPCIPAMNTFDLCDYYDTYGVEDTIAANFLPLGTQVRFPELYGDKVFTVRDRMNAKYNGSHRIDFWKNTRGDAVAFGVKRAKMEIF